MKIALLLSLAGILFVGTARATEQETLMNKVRKYSGHRGLCVCQSGGLNHGRAGYIVAIPSPSGSGEVIVSHCSVWEYTPTGELDTASGCHPYVALAK